MRLLEGLDLLWPWVPLEIAIRSGGLADGLFRHGAQDGAPDSDLTGSVAVGRRRRAKVLAVSIAGGTRRSVLTFWWMARATQLRVVGSTLWQLLFIVDLDSDISNCFGFSMLLFQAALSETIIYN
jgi:hypothetical protein